MCSRPRKNQEPFFWLTDLDDNVAFIEANFAIDRSALLGTQAELVQSPPMLSAIELLTRSNKSVLDPSMVDVPAANIPDAPAPTMIKSYSSVGGGGSFSATEGKTSRDGRLLNKGDLIVSKHTTSSFKLQTTAIVIISGRTIGCSCCAGREDGKICLKGGHARAISFCLLIRNAFLSRPSTRPLFPQQPNTQIT